MSDAIEHSNDEFDLVLQRVVDVPRQAVWQAWTDPEQLPFWFAPQPWTTTRCAIDLRPGGGFSTTMRSPEGDDQPVTGCYLEVVENRRLVWTDALQPGFRPAAGGFMTAVIELEDHPQGTLYTARALHGSREDRDRHAEMGFEQGWGQALDQLVAHIKARPA